MQSKHNKPLVPLAKQLRKEMTKEERHLLNWMVLNTMRIETSKKMQTAPLFWRDMV